MQKIGSFPKLRFAEVIAEFLLSNDLRDPYSEVRTNQTEKNGNSRDLAYTPVRETSFQ